MPILGIYVNLGFFFVIYLNNSSCSNIYFTYLLGVPGPVNCSDGTIGNKCFSFNMFLCIVRSFQQTDLNATLTIIEKVAKQNIHISVTQTIGLPCLHGSSIINTDKESLLF